MLVESLDHPYDTHASLMTNRTFPKGCPRELFILFAVIAWLASRGFRWRHTQQLPAKCKLLLPIAIAQKAEVADPLECVRQHVEKKPSNELVGFQGHGFLPVVISIVLPAEAHLPIFDVEGG